MGLSRIRQLPSRGLRAMRYPHPQQGTVQQDHAGEAFAATFFFGYFTGGNIMQITGLEKEVPPSSVRRAGALLAEGASHR